MDRKESTLSGKCNKNWPVHSAVKMKSAVNVSLPVKWFIWEICSHRDKLPIGSTLGIWERGLYLQEYQTDRSWCNPSHEALFWNLCYQVARQYNLNTDPFGLQGYLKFQDQNKSQHDSSALITQREPPLLSRSVQMLSLRLDKGLTHLLE